MPPSGDITTFQWLTFAIACVGALGTLANAVWNVIQFRLNSYRVKVEATHGVLFGTPGDLTQATWNLNVRVSNLGRSPVTLRSIDVQPAEGVSPAVSYIHWVGPEIAGYRLEAGSYHLWRIDDPLTLQTMLDGGTGEGTVCVFVLTLATGETVESEQIDIHPSGLDGVEIRLVRANPSVKQAGGNPAAKNDES